MNIKRALGRDQCLADNLAAKYPLPAILRAVAAEQVVFQLLQIEYGEKTFDCADHLMPSLRAGPHEGDANAHCQDEPRGINQR